MRPLAPLGNAMKLLDRTELVNQLGATVGMAKAENALSQAQTALGLVTSQFNQEQALRLLDELATSPSVLGIAAKCLRVRVVLKFGQ